jgi:hypothetical protein
MEYLGVYFFLFFHPVLVAFWVIPLRWEAESFSALALPPFNPP